MTVTYADSFSKRVIDILVGGVFFCVLIPFFLIISLAILLVDGSPIFFFQKRMGRNKKPFTMIKFRTMRHDAEKLKKGLLNKNEAPSPMFKMKNDPRFTKIGKILSTTGLDELPQLLHIIKGTMSLVGPRPLPVSEAKKLPSSWDFRYEVKPGLISEWALSGKRYASLNDWKMLEKETLKKDSLGYEVSLIYKTSKMIFSIIKNYFSI